MNRRVGSLVDNQSPSEGHLIQTYAWHSKAMSVEGFIYCDMEHPFLSDLQRLKTFSPIAECLAVVHSLLVSARLVETEILDWRLFRVSDQMLIKWFGKSCPIFELSLHLNWAMPTSSIVYIQQSINFLLSRNLHFWPLYYWKSPTCAHWKWPPLIAYLWSLQYLKGRKCNFRDKGELRQCCI